MQPVRGGYSEKKTKLARSYQELLDEFSHSDLKTVGNYQLGRLIGKGSFGKVYLANHKLTNGSKVGPPSSCNLGNGRPIQTRPCACGLTLEIPGRAQVC